MFELLTFTGLLTANLQSVSPWRGHPVPTGKDRLSFNLNRSFLLDGVLPVADREAAVTLQVFSDWLRHPPAAWTTASWIRRQRDWHAYADGGLCWVFPAYWSNVLERLAPRVSLDSLRMIAAEWCIESVRDLIAKHLEAQRLAINIWPPAWPAWKHDHAAWDELEGLARDGKIDAEVDRILDQRRLPTLG